MNRMRKFNILISTVAKLLAFITLMVYIIRIFPAVLYCMSYKYAEPFITVFNKFDFEAHYEFSSAENLCNNRILYAFIFAEIVFMITDLTITFKSNKKQAAIFLCLYLVITIFMVYTLSLSGLAAWIYQY